MSAVSSMEDDLRTVADKHGFTLLKNAGRSSFSFSLRRRAFDTEERGLDYHSRIKLFLMYLPDEYIFRVLRATNVFYCGGCTMEEYAEEIDSLAKTINAAKDAKQGKTTLTPPQPKGIGNREEE